MWNVDIVSEIITIQGTLDNFNHRERTPAGVEVADNTVLVIFQDKESNMLHDEKSFNITSQPAVKRVDRKQTLNSLFPCQQLIETNLCKKSAEISDEFIVA